MASSPKGNAYFRLLESNNTAQKAFFFSTAQHSGSSCHLYVHVSPPKVPSAQTQAVRALCDAKDQPMRAQLTSAPFRDTWRIKLPGPGSAGIPTPITQLSYSSHSYFRRAKSCCDSRSHAGHFTEMQDHPGWKRLHDHLVQQSTTAPQ